MVGGCAGGDHAVAGSKWPGVVPRSMEEPPVSSTPRTSPPRTVCRRLCARVAGTVALGCGCGVPVFF